MSTVQRAVLATNLARLNDSRGGQSWGYVALGKKNKVQKGLGDIVDESVALAQHSVLFGHTRFATTGAVVSKNSHPFLIGDVLGAHNGIIYNHRDLEKKYTRDFAVDSMHLFAHLNDALPFNDIEGYGAIEWIEAKHSQRIYLSKLRGGDLSIRGIGSFEKCRGILWSSDDKHLAEACGAAGLKTFEYTVETGVVLYVENHKLYVSPDRQLDLASTTSMTRSWRDGMWDEEPDDATMARWARFASSRGLSTERWAKGQGGAVDITKDTDMSDPAARNKRVDEIIAATQEEARKRTDDSAKLWDQKDVWDEYQREAASNADAEMDARLKALDAEIDLPGEEGDVPVSLESAEGAIDAESVANYLREENERYSAK